MKIFLKFNRTTISSIFFIPAIRLPSFYKGRSWPKPIFRHVLNLSTWILCLLTFSEAVFASATIAREQFDRRTPLVQAVEMVGPAVVNIYTEEVAPEVQNPFRGLGENFFDQFFKDFFPPITSQRRSLGSGVIIDKEGHVLTNEHVVAKAVRIKVILIDQREYDARLVGADTKSDLAVIKIESPERLPFVKLGRSDDLMIGETVLAIGNPFGLQHTVTTGIISALNRSISTGEDLIYHDFIQVDASINPGNSGGPLLNINGELIGINTAIYQKAEGIGFAIPIDHAKRIKHDLISFGKVRRGWIGISVQDMTRDILRHYKMQRSQGILILEVDKNSPADKIGIERGDIITSINGHAIKSRLDYRNRLSTYSIGNTVKLAVLHNGQERTYRLKVASIPKSFVAEFVRKRLGLQVGNITRPLVNKFQLFTRNGVVVTKAQRGSPGGRRGISPGDVIRQVNQSSVSNMKEFNKAIIDAGDRDSTLLLVQRGRYGYYVTLDH
jgi:serine protease Do